MTNPIEVAKEIFRRWSDGITFHQTEEFKKFEEGKRFRCTKYDVSFWADDYIEAVAQALTKEREPLSGLVEALKDSCELSDECLRFIDKNKPKDCGMQYNVTMLNAFNRVKKNKQVIQKYERKT